MASSSPPSRLPTLAKIDPSSNHVFIEPAKRIRVDQDINTFLCSRAYADIMTFLQQLNRAMVPCKYTSEDGSVKTKTWPLNSKDIIFSEPVQKLCELLDRLEKIIDETPPSTGPRRFGNVAFREWHARVGERAEELVSTLISPRLNPVFLEKKGYGEEAANAETELLKYLLGSFGSAQRLDYGTGHELSFLAFLAGLWKLGYFEKKEYGVEERGIVVGVIEPYIQLMRRLIRTYTLEPAGSHGVWGLDDHFFLPYIFGSAQLCPAVTQDQLTPIEGSIRGAPKPSAVVKRDLVDMERDSNMYFSAIGFIFDVKKGPFWEHSPILFDISGIRDGWGKINKGMIKMYNAEVLSKFPVVQHFPIGSLFRWERDPLIPAPTSSEHTLSSSSSKTYHQPQQSHLSSQTYPKPTQMQAPPSAYSPAGMPMTAAPWASQTPRPDAPNFPKARAPPPMMGGAGAATTGMPMTAAPWATQAPRGGDAQMLSRPNLRSVYPPTGASDRVDSTVSGIRRLDLAREGSERREEDGQGR